VPAMKRRGPSIGFTLALAMALALIASATAAGAARPKPTDGIHAIKHVVVIMQENRSFDHYFGTYPGADGFPRDATGAINVCIPDPRAGHCVEPFHDPADVNAGGPHGQGAARADINGGKMDGFVAQAEAGRATCANAFDPACGSGAAVPDAMGYKDAREIPNYWAYAENFVLQDRMFEPNASWSLPEHLFMVSEWSARCSSATDPTTCVNALQLPGLPTDWRAAARAKASVVPLPPPNYAWTDLTYLLHRKKVSWGYYVLDGNEPDCRDDDAMVCRPVRQAAKTPGIWNPLPSFATVKRDGELDHVQPVRRFEDAAKRGKLPAVSWIVPSGAVSEHPPGKVSDGQAYVTRLVNAIMRSKDWSSTAIFVSWDDWGGFYDHVVPPKVDVNGYGLRVPGLVISPYAKRGYVDHQTLSFDAYVKFIEDDFLSSARLDPKTDGRPDPRPTVRENVKVLGDLRHDFDFSQKPRPPELLPVHPSPGPASG